MRRENKYFHQKINNFFSICFGNLKIKYKSPYKINKCYFSSSGTIISPLKNDTGTLWRWGSGGSQSYSWRNKNIEKNNFKIPSKMEGFSNVNIQDIACGMDHAAFIVDGCLYTFGNNRYNQLGRVTDEKSKDCLIPEKVVFSNNERVTGVSCGAYHTAAITEDGKLHTWGWGGNFLSGAGGLGSGTKKSASIPTLAQFVTDTPETIVQVACGHQHTLALTKSNKIFSTGRGEFGRLGRGNNGDQLYFEEVTFFFSMNDKKIIKIDCGASHSAALTEDGEVWIWGRNDYGQLGLEDSMGDLYSNEIYPRIIRTFELENIRITDISCGDFHMLATTDTGVVYFWGARLWLTPKPVSLSPSYKNSSIKYRMVKVAGGGGGQYYSMAISENGDLYTWGKLSSSCLAREVKKDANEPVLLSDTLFDGEILKGIACGRHRVLAVTTAR